MPYPSNMQPVRPPIYGQLPRKPQKPSSGEIFKTKVAESFAVALGQECALPVAAFMGALSRCMAEEVVGSFKSTNGLMNISMRAATNGIKFTAEQLKHGTGYAITKGRVGCDQLTQLAMANPKLAAAIAAGAASVPAAWFMCKKLSDGNGFSWEKMPFHFKKSVDSNANEESSGSGNGVVQTPNLKSELGVEKEKVDVQFLNPQDQQNGDGALSNDLAQINREEGVEYLHGKVYEAKQDQVDNHQE